MGDLRTDLERLGERATPRPDAFERLERRRLRKERSRRFAAGGLALMLVLGGSLAAYSAFRDPDVPTTGGGGTSEGFFALWPEQTRAEAEEMQTIVEGGDPDDQWRLKAEAVAAELAREVLLLDDFTIDGMLVINDDFDTRPGPIRVEIATPPPPCPTPVEGDSAVCGPAVFHVTLERLLGRQGIWSVTAVESPEIPIPVPTAAEVEVGGRVELPTSLPDGTIVSAGLVTKDPCGAAAEVSAVEVRAGVLAFELPFPVPADVSECDGYLYVMLPPTSEGQVAVGQIMFADEKPALAYRVQAMAAVPVRFVPGSGTEAVPDVAEISCDGTATVTAGSFEVAAQPDGVHIAVTNTADLPVAFSVGDLGGDGVDPGERKEMVWQLAPGEISVSCSVESPEFGGVASSANLTVVDPDGLFVPVELECATGEAYGQATEYPEGAIGFAGDPVQVARNHISGLEFDDVIERAGYLESEQPVIRVVREGAIAGKVTLFDDGSGGWLPDTLEGCGGTMFGWSDEPTGVTGSLGEPELVLPALCGPDALSNDVNIHDGNNLQVDGAGIDFDTNCLRAPAGESLTIRFANLDEGVPRNISIYAMTACLGGVFMDEATSISCPPNTLGSPVFEGEIVTGVSEIVYEFGPLEPGPYYFQDDVHPQASGVLFVE